MTLDDSYRLCERIARTRARNFYFSFLTLPRRRRQAMCAVYAFMRYCDDLADDETVVDRARQLEAWRDSLHRLADGDTSAHPMLPAFLDTMTRYEIPLSHFDEVITGAEMDLHIREYRTFDDLYRYCYRVASVVGLTCLKVFGYTDDSVIRTGECCGIAFQLTNIIRDVREDAENGRVYIPLEDLERFGIKRQDLSSGVLPDQAAALLEFQADRAQRFYEESLPLLPLVDQESQAALSAMICIYHALLRRIRDRGYDVFSERVSLPAFGKIFIAARCWALPQAALRAEILSPDRQTPSDAAPTRSGRP